jgi:hypothetical protein
MAWQYCPEADFAMLDPQADLREALDIDSMNFLNFIIANHLVWASTFPSSTISS